MKSDKEQCKLGRLKRLRYDTEQLGRPFAMLCRKHWTLAPNWDSPRGAEGTKDTRCIDMEGKRCGYSYEVVSKLGKDGTRSGRTPGEVKRREDLGV